RGECRRMLRLAVRRTARQPVVSGKVSVANRQAGESRPPHTRKYDGFAAAFALPARTRRRPEGDASESERGDRIAHRAALPPTSSPRKRGPSKRLRSGKSEKLHPVRAEAHQNGCGVLG